MAPSKVRRVPRQRGQVAAHDAAIVDQAGDLEDSAPPPQAPANTTPPATLLADPDYQPIPTTDSATTSALASHTTIHACPRCSFTPPTTAVAFEGFQILVYPCPCGQDHADPAIVLSHHQLFTSCEVALAASSVHVVLKPRAPLSNPQVIADAISWPEFERMIQPQPEHYNMLRSQSNSKNSTHVSAPPIAKKLGDEYRTEREEEEEEEEEGNYDEEAVGFYQDRAEYAAAQRASPNVCITCNTPFSTRIQLFKNGRIHTPFIMFRCGCGEHFSREYPGMRVRIEIRQRGRQEQEWGIEQRGLKAKGEFGPAAKRGTHGRVRGKGPISGDKTGEYVGRERVHRKWQSHIHTGPNAVTPEAEAQGLTEQELKGIECGAEKEVQRVRGEGLNVIMIVRCECGRMFDSGQHGLDKHQKKCHLFKQTRDGSKERA